MYTVQDIKNIDPIQNKIVVSKDTDIIEYGLEGLENKIILFSDSRLTGATISKLLENQSITFLRVHYAYGKGQEEFTNK